MKTIVMGAVEQNDKMVVCVLTFTGYTKQIFLTTKDDNKKKQTAKYRKYTASPKRIQNKNE